VRIFVGAGEASGDRILAALLKGLRVEFPGLEVRGFGGPLCAAEGLASPYSLTDLAVNGIGDVLRRGVFLLRARSALLRELESFRPDLVLLVDYPGMNIPLARCARALGIPVHYVAPPQLWAYRNPARRRARLQRDLDQVSLQFLFPFETAAYPGWKGPVTQGHFFPVPAFEPARGTRLLLCPGSRRGVLRRNLPLWIERTQAFFGTLEGVDVLVPEFLVDDARVLCRDATGLQVLTDKDAAFARAGAAIAYPGTMTLELFLQRIPTRVWAVLDPLTLWVGKRTLRGTPHPMLALPNAIAERTVLPEWVGTSRDFRRHPPEIPDGIARWNPEATAEAVHAVWTRMGSNAGVAVGVDSCVPFARKKPARNF
jgi:lipid-A-disaccharide synthase